MMIYGLKDATDLEESPHFTSLMILFGGLIEDQVNLRHTSCETGGPGNRTSASSV